MLDALDDGKSVCRKSNQDFQESIKRLEYGSDTTEYNLLSGRTSKV